VFLYERLAGHGQCSNRKVFVENDIKPILGVFITLDDAKKHSSAEE
jgi:hypothetical protein